MATSVDGLAQAGVLTSGGGAVQLVHPDAYPAGWDPSADLRLPAWEALHHLSRVLLHDGEQAAGRLLRRIGDRADDVRALAFRLYTLCEGQNRAEDGRRYNGLVMAWEGIQRAADAGQTTMFSGGAAAHGGAR
jgi:putative DNA methylase